MTVIIHARVGLQQRVLPEYRAPFFDALAGACLQGLSVFAGDPRADEAIESAKGLKIARWSKATNQHISSGRTYLCLQLGLVSWLKEWNPGVLIVEANPRYLSTPSAIEWMHRKGKPVIGWGLGAPEADQLETALRNRFLKSLDAVIAYSKTGAKQYIETGLRPEQVFVAPNAVTPRPTRPPIERPSLYKDGKPVLLFIGRLQARKRVDLLLQACALLQKEINPRLIIIGDGPDRPRLEQLAREVYPSAEFTGAKHGNALEPYFAAADLFVLPGTGGLAVQQAMAHALPVIVGEADGTQVELVRPENGWILPIMDAQSLSTAICTALQDVPRLRAMGMVSYRIVSEEVNLERMVEAFTQAINSVL